MTGEPAPGAGLQASRLKIDVVVNDEERRWFDLEEARGSRHGAAGIVHERLGLE